MTLHAVGASFTERQRRVMDSAIVRQGSEGEAERGESKAMTTGQNRLGVFQCDNDLPRAVLWRMWANQEEDRPKSGGEWRARHPSTLLGVP